MGYKNFKALQEWQVEGTTLEKLQEQMKQFPRQVKLKKGHYTQDHSISVKTQIEYDYDDIATQIKQEYQEDLEKVMHTPLIEEKKEILDKIFQNIPYSIVKKLEREKQQLIKYIQRKNPAVKHVEIEPKNDEINFWNESEKTKIFKEISLVNINSFYSNLIIQDMQFFLVEENQNPNKNKGSYLREFEQELFVEGEADCVEDFVQSFESTSKK